MKVLIVCSLNTGKLSPFVKDQVDALTELGINCDYFFIRGKGLFGYLKNLNKLHNKISTFKPDLIHAHYGLSGLFSNLQRKTPVITTFHGSDLNIKKIKTLSRWAYKLSKSSIFVSEKLASKVKGNFKKAVIPCGVDLKVFKPEKKTSILIDTVIKSNEINILFSSSFDNKVKNAQLAREACINAEILLVKKINLIELKGFGRTEVSILMNAVDCVLLTSFSEGSPQFIKEAMACNTPIVSTDVGDVIWIYGEIEGCYLASFEAKDVAGKIELAIKFSQEIGKTQGRDRILNLSLDSEVSAKRIIDVYKSILKK